MTTGRLDPAEPLRDFAKDFAFLVALPGSLGPGGRMLGDHSNKAAAEAIAARVMNGTSVLPDA